MDWFTDVYRSIYLGDSLPLCHPGAMASLIDQVFWSGCRSKVNQKWGTVVFDVSHNMGYNPENYLVGGDWNHGILRLSHHIGNNHHPN